MNGFLLFTGQGSDEFSCCLPPGVSSRSPVTLPGGAKIVTWGGAGGDVHHFLDKDAGWLVLSGYVTGLKGGREFATAAEACKIIFETIACCQTAESLRELLESLQGSFGIVCFDTRSGRMLSVSDRMGSRPLWTRRLASGWVVSTHAISAGVFGSRAGFDLGGLGAFLIYGGPVDSSVCLFEGVKTLPPGSVMELSTSQSTCSAWYVFKHRPDESRSRSEWVEYVSETLVNASRRMIKGCGRSGIFFSGGTDSRLAAAAMKVAGGNPVLLTLSDGPNLETRVSMKAAKALGLEHQIIVRDAHWYLRTLNNSVYETGGVYLWTHGHFSSAAKVAKEKHGVDTFVLGDLCEAFSKLFCDPERTPQTLWSDEEFAAVYDRIRLPLYRPPNLALTLSLLKPDVRSEVERVLRERVITQYRRLREAALDPLIVGDMAFRWESVTLLPTFYMFLDSRSSAPERNVMFDPEVHRLLEVMPSKVRCGRNLGAAVIKRLSSEAGWVVNSNSLVPMFWHPWFHKTAKKVKPYMGKIRRAIKGGSHRTTGSWQEHAHLFGSDAAWQQMAKTQEGAIDAFDPSVFDRDQVRAVWQSFMSGDMSRAADFEKLLQFSFINQFITR